jgi:hypothetical protein
MEVVLPCRFQVGSGSAGLSANYSIRISSLSTVRIGYWTQLDFQARQQQWEEISGFHG